jgi:hypothetical protein
MNAGEPLLNCCKRRIQPVDSARHVALSDVGTPTKGRKAMMTSRGLCMDCQREPLIQPSGDNRIGAELQGSLDSLLTGGVAV